MKLQVTNFLRIKSAEIAIAKEKITLIAGDNESGKSSLLRATAACALLRAIPVVNDEGKDQILKGQSAVMVTGGAKKAEVVLSDGSNAAAVIWPKNTVTGVSPVKASAISCGLVQWMVATADSRRVMLRDALAAIKIDTEPTRAALVDAMRSAGISDDGMIDRVWKMIEAKGWDAAAKEVASKWSEATGAWRAVTGTAYGEQKAKTWKPVFWRDEWIDADLVSMRAMLDQAHHDRDEAVKKRAVDGHVVDQLKAASCRDRHSIEAEEEKLAALNHEHMELAMRPSSDHPDLLEISKRSDEIKRKMHEHDAEINEIEKGFKEPVKIPVPPAETNRNAECPACGEGLYISILPLWVEKETVTTPEIMRQHQESMVRAEEESRAVIAHNEKLSGQVEEIEKRIDALKQDLRANEDLYKERSREINREHNDKKDRLAVKINTLQGEILSHRRHNLACDNAQKQLDEIMANEAAGNTVTEATIQDMGTKIDTIARQIESIETMRKADRFADEAAQYAEIKALLAQDGLRSATLAAAVGVVNEAIYAACEVAGWETFTLNDDMEITKSGVPFVLLSKGAQFRANVVMQAVLATFRRDELLLIDGADILDAHGRNGLLKMVRGMTKITTIVAMTAKREYAEAVSGHFDAVFFADEGQFQLISKESDQ
ncbi:MAG: hypothetical protein HQL97_01105 [Magnetococcales bacterium]|nr:hypothetical protein [Magnetococcales bacterium]